MEEWKAGIRLFEEQRRRRQQADEATSDHDSDSESDSSREPPHRTPKTATPRKGVAGQRQRQAAPMMSPPTPKSVQDEDEDEGDEGTFVVHEGDDDGVPVWLYAHPSASVFRCLGQMFCKAKIACPRAASDLR